MRTPSRTIVGASQAASSPLGLGASQPPRLHPPAVGQDGPSSVFLPRSSADWTALGITPPDLQWNCGDASGNLAPAIGSVSLTAGGTGHLYQQTVSGWTAPFCGFPEGTSLRWSTTDSALDLAAGESMLCLAYASAAAASAGSRMLFQAQGATDIIRLANTGIPATLHNSVVTNFAGNHGAIGTVRPWQWYRNGTTNVSGARSDLEELTGTHDETARTGVARCLGSNGSTCVAARFCLFAIWKGVNAEMNGKTLLSTLGWPLSY